MKSKTPDLSEAKVHGEIRWNWVVRAGPGQDAPSLEGGPRELFRAAYLKPLRNAVGELAAKKGPRLSQILQSYPQLQGQGVNDFNPDCKPATLAGIMRQAEHSICKSPAINEAATKLRNARDFTDYVKDRLIPKIVCLDCARGWRKCRVYNAKALQRAR